MNNHCKFFTSYDDKLLRFDLGKPVLCQPGDFIFDTLCAIKLVYNLSRAIESAVFKFILYRRNGSKFETRRYGLALPP